MNDDILSLYQFVHSSESFFHAPLVDKRNVAIGNKYVFDISCSFLDVKEMIYEAGTRVGIFLAVRSSRREACGQLKPVLYFCCQKAELYEAV